MTQTRNLILIMAFFFASGWARGQETSESFMIYYFSDHVKVVAPAQKKKNAHAIIENKTLSKLIGHIESPEGKILIQVAIAAGSRASYSLKEAGDHIVFIPLSPASQEVELTYGRAAYEIPAQDQN